MPRQSPVSEWPFNARENSFEKEPALHGELLGLPLVQRVAAIRSQQASRITWHAHDCFEMLFLLDGATSYEFENCTPASVELTGGQFLVIPPKVRHRGLFDVRHPVQLCGLMINPGRRQATLHSPFTADNLKWIREQCLTGGLKVCRMGQELRRSMRALPSLIRNAGTTTDDPLQMAQLRLTLCSVLLEAARQLTSTRAFPGSQTVDAACRYMEQHFQHDISMSDVIRASHCSRARLFQLFKESTGLTPNDFLARIRVKAAQQALTQTAAPITHVAATCGFSTSQYFSTVFRKYTGQTPQSFRQQAQLREIETSAGR